MLYYIKDGKEIEGKNKKLCGGLTNFAQLDAFAISLLSDQTDIPEEFNKLFKKSFWDILA